MFKLNCVILSLFNTLVSFAEKRQMMMIFVMNNISYIYIIHIFYLSHIYCLRYNSLRLVARQVPNCKQVGFVRLFFSSMADNDCSDDEKLHKIQCSRLTFHKVRNIDSLTHWIRYLEMLIFDRGEPTLFKWIFARYLSRGQVRTANPRTERCL